MRESVALLKEQLRMQGKEVQKLNAEKAKHDAKIQHVLKISQEKIEDLKITVTEKEAETKAVHTSIKAGVYTEGTTEKDQQLIDDLQESTEEDQQLIVKLQESLDQSKKENDKLADDLKKAEKNKSEALALARKKTADPKDPKITMALKKLKHQNEDLQSQLQNQGSKTILGDKEKEILTLELKKLREKPDPTKEFKAKIKQQEKKQKKSIESLQKKIDEKTELIKSFEKIIYDAQEGDDSKLPSEIIKDLKTNIEAIQQEKKELDKSLNDLKKDFKKKLDEKIKKLEEEFGEGTKQAPPKKEDVEEVEEGAPAWMATFSDMVTLMLVFFILMYAIASKNVQTFKSAIIGAEAKSIGVLEALNAVEVEESLKKLKPEQSDDILSGMSDAAEDTDMTVETSASKIVVRVPGASLFKPGQADLQLKARSLLDAVIKEVNKHPEYKVHIQGHTDDEPISTEKFPTNWELSSSRATAVLRYFVDKGAEPERMTATGYADTFPLGRNDTVPGRAKNRRVEFVLEKEN